MLYNNGSGADIPIKGGCMSIYRGLMTNKRTRHLLYHGVRPDETPVRNACHGGAFLYELRLPRPARPRRAAAGRRVEALWARRRLQHWKQRVRGRVSEWMRATP